MPSGSTAAHPSACAPLVLRLHRRQRGATYLLLLFMLAVMAAGMAALGTRWAVAAQREREAELLFRGTQFSRALASWRDATPAGQPAAPMQLEELLQDTRGPVPRHHLRRLFTDPFTGQADWELLRGEDGRISALASRSRQPALRRLHKPLRAEADPARPAVGDWLFQAEARAPTAASTASSRSDPRSSPR